jgi:hypothetical protein
MSADPPETGAAPCRLCQANDRETVVDGLAEALWESRRVVPFDPPWSDAGIYWQSLFRELAHSALHHLRPETKPVPVPTPPKPRPMHLRLAEKG